MATWVEARVTEKDLPLLEWKWMTLYFKWDVYDVQVTGRIGMGLTHMSEVPYSVAQWNVSRQWCVCVPTAFPTSAAQLSTTVAPSGSLALVAATKIKADHDLFQGAGPLCFAAGWASCYLCCHGGGQVATLYVFESQKTLLRSKHSKWLLVLRCPKLISCTHHSLTNNVPSKAEATGLESDVATAVLTDAKSCSSCSGCFSVEALYYTGPHGFDHC